jgi:hypothetical protein
VSVSQNQLRAAMRAVADEVTEQDVPPLSLPAARQISLRAATLPQFRALGLLRTSRLLTAAAAAAAVIAVATSAVVAGRSHAAPPAGARKTNQSDVATGSRIGPRGVPPYYLALIPFGKPSPSPRMEGQVRETATGRIVAVIHPPRPFRTITTIAGAADDRTFVLAAQKTPHLLTQPVKFFLARFNPALGRVSVTPLSIPETPASYELMGIAISPNGADLAVGVSIAVPAGQNKIEQTARLSIYTLATGQVKVWQQASGAICVFNDAAACMSWSGGTLAFNWSGAPSMQGVWLLNTATPGGGLLADSRLAVSAGPSPFTGWHWDMDGLLIADGDEIVLPMWKDTNPRKPLDEEFQVFSARTGNLLQVRYLVRGGQGQAEVLQWSNPAGTAVIAEAPIAGTSTNAFGVLRGDRFTPLPGAPAPYGQITQLVF